MRRVGGRPGRACDEGHDPDVPSITPRIRRCDPGVLWTWPVPLVAVPERRSPSNPDLRRKSAVGPRCCPDVPGTGPEDAICVLFALRLTLEACRLRSASFFTSHRISLGQGRHLQSAPPPADSFILPEPAEFEPSEPLPLADPPAFQGADCGIGDLGMLHLPGHIPWRARHALSKSAAVPFPTAKYPMGYVRSSQRRSNEVA